MAKFKFKKVTKLDEVPEAYRGVYVEKDGGFGVDPAKLEDFEWDDKEELSGALERERKERKDAKAALERFKDLDPDKAREALDKLQKLEEKKLMDKGEFDRLLTKRKEEFDLAEAELKRQLAERDSRLDNYELINPIRDAALKAGVLPEDIEDVLKITSHRFKLDENRKPVVLDKDGDVSSALTVEKFWAEEFKTQKPKFYGASGAGGSGAPAGGTGGGSGGAKTVKRDAFEKMAPVDQAAHFKSGGSVVD
ncbi:MAG: hypothetical protein QOD00_1708 [Blastocatellia bacterium]|jgi:hypothetical protein|nr:hypothetical protein [Blastocatellia bacterium]